MTIFTVMLIVVFVLVVIPILYWIGLGLAQLIRHAGGGRERSPLTAGRGLRDSR